MIGRPLPANADIFALLVAGADRHFQQFFDCGIALVETIRDQAGIAIQSQGQLGQIVRPDREAVEIFQEFLGQQCVGRDLAHHDQAQTVLAPLQTMLRQQLDDLARFLHRAHERHHDFHVGVTHFIANLLHR